MTTPLTTAAAAWRKLPADARDHVFWYARDAARCVSQIAAKATLPADGKRLRDEAKALRAAIKLLRIASRGPR